MSKEGAFEIEANAFVAYHSNPGVSPLEWSAANRAIAKAAFLAGAEWQYEKQFQKEKGMKDETAWLLETSVNGRPAWFKGKDANGAPEYTFESTEAVKYTSREEANMANKTHSLGYEATDHMWCAPSQA